MDAESSTVEPLPLYLKDHVPPGSPLDALLTRIAAPISAGCPNARTFLEFLVAKNKAPAYDGPEVSQPRSEPIERYPRDDPEVRNSPEDQDSTRVKQQIVDELFNSIGREDAEAVALLIQHNLVTANTTSHRGETPLLKAISTRNIAIVKEILDLGADWHNFGTAVSTIICSDIQDQI